MTIYMRRTLYKWTCYGALMFVAIILQTTLLSGIRVLNCSPSLIPFIVAAISLHDGVGDGMIAGLCGGVLCDAIYSNHEAFYTVTLTVLAFVICLMNTVMYWKNYGMSLLDWAVILILMHLMNYCIYMLLAGRGHISALLYVIPGEFAATLPFTPFLYMIVTKTGKSFEQLEE